jgi:ubiquinone/menaquinone biosynthesis C-methylase UbiE
VARHVGPIQKRERPSQRNLERVTGFECEADVLVGLERFAYAELSERLGDRVRFGATARAGTLRFRYTGDLAALLDLRSVISVYLVRHFGVPRPKALLGHQHFEALVGLTELVRGLAGADAYDTFRLSAAGEDSSVLTRLKTELAQRTGLSSAADEGDLLLRLRRSRRDEGWEVLMRISPRPLATRPWRVCNRPGALNATLAHSMVELTQPAPEDIVLNLGCGSGTLLVERLSLCEARSAIGCDIDPAALECAGENLHAAGFAREATLEQWDAGQLPLADRSVRMICSDLPFGQLVGSHRENEQLYPRILAETARVAQPGARMVLLTHEVRLLDRVAAQYTQQWSLQEVIRVRSGGMTPRVYLFRRSRSD